MANRLCFTVPLLMVLRLCSSSHSDSDGLSGSKSLRVLNQKHLFQKWPNNKVYFYLDDAYSTEDKQFIKQAMSRVTADLNTCVTFVEVNATAFLFKVKITPTKSDGFTAATYCYTYPGLYDAARLQGQKEQIMTLTRGPHGCLDGSLHRVMKYLALLLGKRNEHQKSDRDQHITMLNSNILPEMVEFGYRKYAADEASSACPYDYCSITHNQPADFALDSSHGGAFIVKNPPFFIPALDRLSECDCKELSNYYGCEASLCAPLDCAAQIPSHLERGPANLPPHLPASQSPPFNTVATNPAVESSVTTTKDASTVCYSLPAVTQPVSFAVLTTITPSNTGSVPGNQNLSPIALSANSCSISAGTFATVRSRIASKPTLRVVDTDPKYIKWPGKRVPYYIDSRYTPEEQLIVQKALATVSASMKSCVHFVEVPASSTEYKLKITPFSADGITKEKQCYSYPGIYAEWTKTHKEQVLVLAPGPDGCLGGTSHNILKYFAIVLGKRTEHQRPDRDDHIEVLPGNIMTGMEFAYEKYDWSKAKTTHPYDYCSVTHNQPDIFAKPGTQAFKVKDPPYRIPVLDRFSEIDCQELSEAYSCDPAKCEPLDCKTLVLTTVPTSTIKTQTTTPTVTSTTTAPITTVQATTVLTTAPSTAPSTSTSTSMKVPSTSAPPPSTAAPTSAAVQTSAATSRPPTSGATTVMSTTSTLPSSTTSTARMTTTAGVKSTLIPTTNGGAPTTTQFAISKMGDSTAPLSTVAISNPSSPTCSCPSSTISGTTNGAPSSTPNGLSSTEPPFLSTVGSSAPPPAVLFPPFGSGLSPQPNCEPNNGPTMFLPVTVTSTPLSGIQVCYRVPPVVNPTIFSAHLSLSPTDLGYVGFVTAASSCAP